MKQHYGSKAKPLFTDTDSLCHLIQTQNVFEDQKTRAELFDLSNYPEGPYKDSTNKKVLGKFKDECEGKSPSEFIGLRPKMYSLECGSDEKKTAKGIKTSYAKTHIKHADYRRCLLTDDPNHDPQHLPPNTTGSRSGLASAAPPKLAWLADVMSWRRW